MDSAELEKPIESNFTKSDMNKSFDIREDQWGSSSEDDNDKVDEDSLTTIKITKTDTHRKLNFKCPVDKCESAFRRNCLLQDHLRKHSKERPFHCNVGDCTKTFTKEPHLKRHKILVHEKICEQVCDIPGCGIIVNNKYSLKKHKLKVHNASQLPFFCSECSIGFRKKFMLNQHNFIHTGDPPFKCTICNIGFTLQRDLTKHNRNHKTYTCGCGEIFHRWSELRKHGKTCPFRRKEYICSVCDKKLSNKFNLNAHMQSHQNSNTFHCPYMGCTRSYQYNKNLTFHISVFHERKNDNEELPCSDCGKVFAKKLYLNRHIKTMHSNVPKAPKLRASRKDKGKTRTYTAAALSGLKLTQKQNIEALLDPEKILSIHIHKMDLSKKMKIVKIDEKLIENNDTVNTENAIIELSGRKNEENNNNNEAKSEEMNEKNIEDPGKANNILNLEDAVIEVRDHNSIMDQPDQNPIILQDTSVPPAETSANFDIIINLDQNVVIEEIDIPRLEISVQESKIDSVSGEIASKQFSDDVLLNECSLVLNRIEECLVSC